MYVYGNIFDCRFPTHNFSGLESESRTLAQRISAISLSSADEPPPNKTYQIDTALSEKKNVSSSISFQQLGAQKLHTVFQPRQHYSDRKIPKPTTPRLDGSNIRKYEWKAERNW